MKRASFLFNLPDRFNEVIYVMEDFDKGALRHPRRRRILSSIRRAVEENIEGASNNRL